MTSGFWLHALLGEDLNVLNMSLQISVEFRNLGPEYQDVISDICHRMGVGMADFLEKKVGSMKEWDWVNFTLLMGSANAFLTFCV